MVFDLGLGLGHWSLVLVLVLVLVFGLGLRLGLGLGLGLGRGLGLGTTTTTYPARLSCILTRVRDISVSVTAVDGGSPTVHLHRRKPGVYSGSPRCLG